MAIVPSLIMVSLPISLIITGTYTWGASLTWGTNFVSSSGISFLNFLEIASSSLGSKFICRSATRSVSRWGDSRDIVDSCAVPTALAICERDPLNPHPPQPDPNHQGDQGLSR
jgi:hypothetical protein